MIKKYWAAFLLVGLVCTASTMFLMSKLYNKPLELPNNDYKELVHSIDSLSSYITEINKTNDSLRSVIDTTKLKIIINQKEYEEDFVNITNQPIGNDIEFFSNYLSESYERFFGGYNSSTVKAN